MDADCLAIERVSHPATSEYAIKRRPLPDGSRGGCYRKGSMLGCRGS